MACFFLGVCEKKPPEDPWVVTKEGKYLGEWQQGMRHGSGRLEIKREMKTHGVDELIIYEGQFKDDQMHGKGVMTFGDGRKYEGQFKQNCFHGDAVMKFPEDVSYVGQYADGFKHGHGTLIYPEQPKSWEGQWVKGKMHGKGVLTDELGIKKEGLWAHGKIVQDEVRCLLPGEPPNSDAAPKTVQGRWLAPPHYVEQCRILADGQRSARVAWFFDPHTASPIWTEPDGHLGTEMLTKKTWKEEEKAVILGQFQKSDPNVIMWKNGDTWKRAPTEDSPEDWRVVAVGGAVVRAGRELKTPKVGSVKKGDKVSVVDVQGRRAKISAPIEGWLSVVCIVLGDTCQVLVPDEEIEVFEIKNTPANKQAFTAALGPEIHCVKPGAVAEAT